MVRLLSKAKLRLFAQQRVVWDLSRTILATASFSCFLTVTLGATHPAMTPKLIGPQEVPPDP
jgi:hypothetical protein